MLEPNGTQLWIDVDNDTASGRSFLVDCYEGKVSKYEAGNAMIRIEGEEAVSFAEIIIDFISVEEERLELAFRAAPPGNDTEVKATLQTGSKMGESRLTRIPCALVAKYRVTYIARNTSQSTRGLRSEKRWIRFTRGNTRK
ncbi:MAG: hypothetical protein FGF50_10130 [Candidatus Brockarchaeota archaeon]|nr:hypothetical protein [Candidatus Brockarchaeota archaeon]